MKPRLPARIALLLVIGPILPGGAAAQMESIGSRDRANLIQLLRIERRDILDAAAAMPADKFGFAPTEGAFASVRTFGHQLKHLAATNYILAAAALGEQPPSDAGDEAGPDSVVTKEQILRYAGGSFDAVEHAISALGDGQRPVRSSPISPFQGGSATRLALIVETLMHAFDHYGQMVVYLRMNGVIPPASRR